MASWPLATPPIPTIGILPTKLWRGEFSVCRLHNQVRNGQRCVNGTFSESVHLSHSVGREVFERPATQPTNLRLLKVLKHRWPGHSGVRNHQTIHSQLQIHSRQDRRSVTGPLCTVAEDRATIMLFVSTSLFCFIAIKTKSSSYHSDNISNVLFVLRCEIRSDLNKDWRFTLALHGITLLQHLSRL